MIKYEINKLSEPALAELVFQIDVYVVMNSVNTSTIYL